MCPQSSLRFVFCLRHTAVAGPRRNDLVLPQELQCNTCPLKSFQAMAVTVAQSLCVFVLCFLGLATVLPSFVCAPLRTGHRFSRFVHTYASVFWDGPLFFPHCLCPIFLLDGPLFFPHCLCPIFLLDGPLFSPHCLCSIFLLDGLLFFPLCACLC